MPDQDWKSYCVYSGKHLPAAAMSSEHVIPKSLGGTRATVIRASRDLNSLFATTIDAPITRDPMVQFGRRDMNARGHSKKVPVPILKGAHLWRSGQPWYEPEQRYSLGIPEEGFPVVYDRKTGQKQIGLRDGGYIIPNLQIDHVARMRFTLKTLLGLGWKMFGQGLFSAVDVPLIRQILQVPVRILEGEGEGHINYSDPFLVRPEDRETHPLPKLEPMVVRKGKTTILMREFGERFEWSVACVGYLVGSVSLPILSPILRGDVRPKGGIRLVVASDRLVPELVAPFET